MSHIIPIKRIADSSWYLDEIKKLFVGNRNKDDNSEEAFRTATTDIEKALYELKINEYLFVDNEKTVFEKLIISDFANLKNIKKNLPNKLEGVFYSHDEQGKKRFIEPWDKIHKTYERFSPNNINTLIVDKFALVVCPYCNRNFINNIDETKATAQLDHFYHRSEYPIFSLCLYNLVPSCPSCNHKKQQPINYSPHDDIDWDIEFKFTYLPISADFMNDKQIKVKFVNYNDNILQLGLNKLYEFHTDDVIELIKKSFLYNDSRIIELLSQFPSLFESKDEILKIVFGNYIKSEDLSKRPLSKLTKDILEELGVH